jgi:hypothetical protein
MPPRPTPVEEEENTPSPKPKRTRKTTTSPDTVMEPVAEIRTLSYFEQARDFLNRNSVAVISFVAAVFACLLVKLTKRL